MHYYTTIIILILLSLIVLSILIYENNRIPIKKKRLFFATNILIAVSAIFECAGIHIGGNPDFPHWVLSIVKALDYTFTPLTGGALIALIQKPNKINKHIKWLFVANTVFQLVSAFTGWMVIIDDQNHYTHGKLYPVYMAFYVVVLIILAIELVIYGKSFRKQNRVSLYSIMILIFVGIGLQEILGSEHRVAYLTVAFAASYLFIHYSEFSQMELDEEINEQKVRVSIDPLTGTLSRFAYNEALNSFEDCIPEDLAVFLIDINGLKAANDFMGHEAGDELICGAADCVVSTLGKGGKTYRIGGDEFVVITNMTKEQADEALIELKKATRVWAGNKVKQLSVSAGYALSKDFEGYSVEKLTKEADNAMYIQKRAYYQQKGIDRRKSSRE